MRRHHSLPAIAFGICLIAASQSTADLAAEELAPLRQLRLEGADATTKAQLLVALRRANGDDRPLATVALLETDEGNRARLIAFTDHVAGVSVQRFEDLNSGWWAEWSLDSGMTNLGDAADYPTPGQWFDEVEERRRSQRPTATLSIVTSDGASTVWEEPAFVEPSAAAEASAEALASLAAALRESAVPTSVRDEVGRLVQLLDRSSEAAHFHDLISALSDALLISGPASDRSSGGVDEGEIRLDSRAPGMEVQPLADLLREIETGSPRRPDPEAPPGSVDPSPPGG